MKSPSHRRGVHWAIAAAGIGLLLSGCGTLYTVVPEDAVLSRACDKPGLEGDTLRDLAKAYLARGKAIDECNCRLKAIRERKVSRGANAEECR